MSGKAWAVGGGAAIAIIIALVVLPLFLPTKWEYEVAGIPDLEFFEEMNAYGGQGWEAIFARRAINSATDEASYEIIFKRPVRPWLTAR